MNKQKLWNVVKILLKIGFTILLLYLVFSNIDANALKELFLNSNPFYILLAFVFYFLSIFVACWRNLTLLKSIGLNLEFWFSLRLYLLGMFYNISLPGGVGGDGYKIYILRKKYRLPTKRIFLAMLFDRLSGLWAIVFLGVALIILIPTIELPYTWPFTIFFSGSSQTGVTLTTEDIYVWPVAFLFSITAVYYLTMRRYFKDYSENFFTIHVKAGLLQALQIMTVISILLSQDFSGKFAPYLFSFLLSTLAANIPISFAGVGTREWVMLNASPIFGMDQHLALFLSVTFLLISTLSALTGVWFVYRSKEFEPAPTQQEAERFEENADKKIRQN